MRLLYKRRNGVIWAPADDLCVAGELLAEKTRGATREGKAYYACRFRDARRTASFMAWADSPRFQLC